MKALVIYDTHYGNTKTVAEAIAGELAAEGYKAILANVRDRAAPPLEGEVLFLGSPVRFGNTSGGIKKYIEKLDRAFWQGKPVFVFTTILALPGNATEKQRQAQDKYDIGAGRKLRDYVREKGLYAAEDTLWVEVTGLKGPLIETGVEKARLFTQVSLRALKIPAGQGSS